MFFVRVWGCKYYWEVIFVFSSFYYDMKDRYVYVLLDLLVLLMGEVLVV